MCSVEEVCQFLYIQLINDVFMVVSKSGNPGSVPVPKRRNKGAIID